MFFFLRIVARINFGNTWYTFDKLIFGSGKSIKRCESNDIQMMEISTSELVALKRSASVQTIWAWPRGNAKYDNMPSHARILFRYRILPWVTPTSFQLYRVLLAIKTSRSRYSRHSRGTDRAQKYNKGGVDKNIVRIRVQLVLFSRVYVRLTCKMKVINKVVV